MITKEKLKKLSDFEIIKLLIGLVGPSDERCYLSDEEIMEVLNTRHNLDFQDELDQYINWFLHCLDNTGEGEKTKIRKFLAGCSGSSDVELTDREKKILKDKFNLGSNVSLEKIKKAQEKAIIKLKNIKCLTVLECEAFAQGISYLGGLALACLLQIFSCKHWHYHKIV